MHPSTVVLIAFFTSAVTATGTVYVMERYGVLTPKAQVASDALVPDLRGLVESDARSSASAAHLSLFVAGREPAPEAKPKTVIRQSLAPGQRVARDYPLSVVLAEELVKVPSVTSLTVQEARQRLEQRGYGLQLGAPAPDPSVAPGLIVSQVPKSDTAYAKGGLVVVQVSSGPGEIDMPKLAGVAFTKAKTELEQLGLKPVVVWTELGETPVYVVLNQKPTPGTKLKPGSEVILTVNR